ncbi:MAG: glycosyltransferase family A protein [Candidatus Electrothrix aestuarii]|uniref:Glycosyltransferase family A protein n=1 Tax=Candidatus Electrothrix aestuarii TaxID=3062594 RepID=A0AAU8LX32_9BACT|nr:glycosyltransferase family A protein [Candidatus Electrothrix aestuarii]
MKNPLVSVVIPVYCRRDLIRETLSSVVRQTYPNWEAIVVDDHSTDDTCAVVESFARQDCRIKLIRKSVDCPRGANSSRNIGIDNSRGKYIIFLDSDDCMSESCIQTRVEIMENDPSIDFAVFQTLLFHDVIGDMDLVWNLLENEKEDIDRFLLLDVPWFTASPIWKRKVLGGELTWDSAVLSWQDWFFHIKAILSGLKYKKYNIVDVFYRQHTGESIGDKSTSPSHLESHERVIGKVYQLLADKNMLNIMRRREMCGVYLWLSLQWLKKDKAKSISLWKQCKVILCDDFLFFVVWLYLFFQHIYTIEIFLEDKILKKSGLLEVGKSNTFRKISHPGLSSPDIYPLIKNDKL